MNACRTYTLTDVVERYCAMQFNDHRRGFKNMLLIGTQVWEEIFTQTLQVETSRWLPVESSSPYPIVNLPENMGRFLGLYEEVPHNGSTKLRPVHKSKSVSTAPIVDKVCSCSANCGCGAACAEANSFTYTETPVVVDDVTYTKKQWFELNSNGDVMEWVEMPVKAYRALENGGQFSADFSDDFSQSMEDYDVQTIKLQRRITKVEVKPCGCVAETPRNKTLLATYCGCTGNAVVVPCHESRTTYRPRYDNKALEIIGGTATHYLARFQVEGASAEAPVPAYSLKAFWDGINYYSKAYNPTVVNPNIPLLAKREYNRSRRQIIEYLNPVDWEAMQPHYHRQREAIEIQATVATNVSYDELLGKINDLKTYIQAGENVTVTKVGDSTYRISAPDWSVAINNLTATVQGLQDSGGAGVAMDVVANYAAINIATTDPRFVYVTTDESNNNNTTLYFFDGTNLKLIQIL